MGNQNFTYYMWSPHEKAKLFKRYTGNVPVELKDNEVIDIQDNRYVYVGAFKWVETTTLESAADQPLSGLPMANGYLTIRTNSLHSFSMGDIIELPKGCSFAGQWIITDGKTISYVYTPKQVQTYQTLPLGSVG